MLLALLIFLPSLVFFPHTIYSTGILYIPRRLKIDFNILIITLIVLLSLINRILHLGYNTNEYAYIPFTAAYILTFFFSRSLESNSLKYLLILISIESFVAILEFVFSTQTFFKGFVSTRISQWYNSGLLYYQRSFGLSNNSSEVAYKIFVAFLIFDLNLISKKIFKRIILILLVLGLVVTFNRSVIISLIIFYFLSNIKSFIKFFSNLKIKYYLLIFSLILFTLTIVYFDTILYQFTRGISISVDANKRTIITNHFIDFISNHFFFGNGSYKLFYNLNGANYHAHNSFLQVFATHGFFIFLLYILLIIVNINSKNYRFILPIIALSLTQYGIFWGISILDIAFLYFLIFYRNDSSIIQICNGSYSNKK